MAVSKDPKYAKDWKTRRQTRLKPSGMTAKLEYWDNQWRQYDRQDFIDRVSGNNGLSDIDRMVKGFHKAHDEIKEILHAHDKDYDRLEKGLIIKVLGDIAGEIDDWTSWKKTFLASDASAKAVQSKLTRLNGDFAALNTKLEKTHEDLEKTFAKFKLAEKMFTDTGRADLSKAGKLDQLLAALDSFEKDIDDAATQWTKADAANEERQTAVNEVPDAAHSNNADLKTLVANVSASYSTARRQLNVWHTDIKLWKGWAEKVLAHH